MRVTGTAACAGFVVRVRLRSAALILIDVRRANSCTRTQARVRCCDELSARPSRLHTSVRGARGWGSLPPPPTRRGRVRERAPSPLRCEPLAPTALAACRGFHLCYKYIWYWNFVFGAAMPNIKYIWYLVFCISAARRALTSAAVPWLQPPRPAPPRHSPHRGNAVHSAACSDRETLSYRTH